MGVKLAASHKQNSLAIIKVARGIARFLGSDIKVHREKYNISYYNNQTGVIHLYLRDWQGRVRPPALVAHDVFHELAHRIQQVSGVYSPYFTTNHKDPAFKRVALKAERHADKIAFDLCKLFGIKTVKHSYSKEGLYKYFGWKK